MNLVLFLVSIGIGLPIMFAVIRREYLDASPFVFVWLTLLVFFCIPSWYDLAIGWHYMEYRGGEYQATADQIFSAHIYFYCIIFLYLALLSLCRFSATKLDIDFFRQAEMVQGVFYFPLVLGLLWTAFSVFYAISKFGLSVFQFDFTEARESIPVWVKFSVHVLPKFYLGYILVFLVCKKYGSAIALSVFSFVLFMSIGGTRQNIIQIAIAIGLYLILFWNAGTMKKAFILASVVVLSVSILSLALIVRNLGGVDARLDFMAALWNDGAMPTLEIRDIELRGVYYYFIANWDDPEFWRLSYFFRTILLWLPSSFAFGFKPDDFEYTMFHVFNGDIATMHPTLPGSIFADSGPVFFLWVALIVFVRYCVQVGLSRLSGAYFLACYVAICMAGVMAARGALYSALLVSLAAVAAYCVFQLWGRVSRGI